MLYVVFYIVCCPLVVVCYILYVVRGCNMGKDSLLRKPGSTPKVVNRGLIMPDEKFVELVENNSLANQPVNKKVTRSITLDEEVYQNLRSMKYHGEIKDVSNYINELVRLDLMNRGKI